MFGENSWAQTQCSPAVSNKTYDRNLVILVIFRKNDVANSQHDAIRQQTLDISYGLRPMRLP